METTNYKVMTTNAADKDLRPLRAILDVVEEKVNGLETDPEAGELLTADLIPARSLHWRVNKTDYRAAYLVLEAERVCVVFCIGTRENFYRDAARRIGSVTRQVEEGVFSLSGGDKVEVVEEDGPT